MAQGTVWSSEHPISTNLDTSRVAILCSSPLTASLRSLATDLRVPWFSTQTSSFYKIPRGKAPSSLTTCISSQWEPYQVSMAFNTVHHPLEKFCPPLACLVGSYRSGLRVLPTAVALNSVLGRFLQTLHCLLEAHPSSQPSPWWTGRTHRHVIFVL